MRKVPEFPTLQLGKGGPTPAWQSELRQHLKTYSQVRVRFLAAGGAREVRAEAAQLASDMRLQLVDVRGKTAVFGRRARPPTP